MMMKLRVTGKSKGLGLIFGLAVLLMGTGVCSAGPTTYSVDRTIGTGTITGFIETDGSLGVLGAGNFVDWSLLLNVGTDTYTLYGPSSGNNSSVYVQGSDVTATATQVLFNFNGSDNKLRILVARSRDKIRG